VAARIHDLTFALDRESLVVDRTTTPSPGSLMNGMNAF
jgi:hypothetical protein